MQRNQWITCKILTIGVDFAERELYKARSLGKEKGKEKKSVIVYSFLCDCILETLGVFVGVDGSLEYEYTFVRKDYNFPLQSWKDWKQYCLTNLSL